MLGSLIQNVRDWFLNKRNGRKQDAADSTVVVSTAGSLATSETKPPKKAGDAGDVSPRPREGGARRRPRGRRGSGKRRSPGQREDFVGSSVDPVIDERWDTSVFEVPPVEEKMRFHDLSLPDQIMHGIYDLGFQYCTPVQAAILPKALDGADAAGRAQTGTGKTAVFLIDILTHLLGKPATEAKRPGTPRALVLAPTRELALQIEKDGNALGKYTPIKIVAVFGGMDYDKQRRLLSEGPVDIVAATPGRLLDFMRQRDVRLDKVEVLVIDEADRMLDMGFIPDVQQIIRATPPKSKRQTMLFSATLTPEVARFAAQWTRDPVFVEVEPEHVTVDTIEQVVYITTIDEKFPLLYNLITRKDLDRVIVFGNRRDQTRRLMERLMEYGISSALLSGDVDQKKRIKTLEDFRNGRIRILVATDVAARGLHIEGVSHVVNYNLPMNPEDYVHRIGRTGRAGASGTSVSFASEDDSFQIPGIEEFLGRELHCVHPEEEWLDLPPPPEKSGRPTGMSRTSARRPKRESAPSSRSGRSRGRRPHGERGASESL